MLKSYNTVSLQAILARRSDTTSFEMTTSAQAAWLQQYSIALSCKAKTQARFNRQVLLARGSGRAGRR